VEGVEWEPGERVYLVVGLASTNDEHVKVLSNLLDLLQAPENLSELIHTTNPMIIVERLTRERSEKGWN
jgi:phosphocarrier protein FPr